MKILHIGKYYPPFFGGIEKINFDLVENLNKENYQTDVFCFNHKSGTQMEETIYKVYRTSVIITKFSTPISLSIFNNLRKIYHKYDIIHLHMPNPIAAMALQFLPFKGKLVLHWHLDIVKQKLLKIVYRPFQTHILKRADAIIATSPEYLKYSKDLAPFLKKCHIIPLGIDNNYLEENATFKSKLLKKYKDKKIVFSLGRLIYYKGFKYLIAAAKFLDEDTIILIGGTGVLKNELQKKITESHLESKVQLIGKIPAEELGEYYKRADVFCLPSIERSEAFGIVLLEAMANKCPVISTSMGSGTSWVNQHNHTGLVIPPKNEKAIASAIKAIINNKELSASFSVNAYNRFQEEFKLEDMVMRTVRLYRGLFSENP